MGGDEGFEAVKLAGEGEGKGREDRGDECGFHDELSPGDEGLIALAVEMVLVSRYILESDSTIGC